jgi:hypothetical protein
MKSDTRIDYTTRDNILKLLSDAEIAKVSAVETEARLADGDEYVDLQQLELGVRRAVGTFVPMLRALPRKAVEELSWTKILAQLGAYHDATTRPRA